ncbi:MAG: protein-ADP-ribose hydrolase [Eubacteriales bacterium]|nr:protein-ADP-ribose hydrolase [Eubacteriales bacterium]
MDEKTMTQDARRIYLIQELQKEMPEFAKYPIPKKKSEQEEFLRGLFNVRPVHPVSEEFTSVQDAYLKERAAEKGITDAASLPVVPSDARLVLWKGDITTLRCDAVVNAANSSMTGCWRWCHYCIDNAIQTYSGYQTRRDCAEYMENKRKKYGDGYMQPTSLPMLTSAYNLPSKYIVHVVGPIVTPFLTAKHKEQLAACYRNCLNLAEKHGCTNIAFCSISTGVFMFPPEKAAVTAVATVKKWLDEHPDSCMQKVIFNVFSDSQLAIYQELLGR